ncbi:MAG: VWA domain-containing protein [Gemmataceae bacterium]
MLGFAAPELLLAAPLAALAGWHAVRRRRPAVRYPSLTLVDGLPRGRAGRAVWGTAVLRGLAVLALVLAAAGPRTPDLQTRLPADGIAIMLLVDVSGSMAEPDFARPAAGPPVSRIDAAKEVYRLFVLGGDAPDGTRFDGRPRDQIGLVSFAAVPTTDCPLTLNHSVLVRVADSLKPKDGPDAGTNLGDAIAEGLVRLEAAGGRRKVLVLLSDGEHNVHLDGPNAPLKPRQAAQLAAALGVPVYAIDCGGDPKPGASAEAVQQREDGRKVLASVAELTGGRSFAANSPDELRQAVRQIDALETRPAEAFRYRRYHEYGPWCAVAGIGLLAAGGLLERTRWRRVP